MDLLEELAKRYPLGQPDSPTQLPTASARPEPRDPRVEALRAARNSGQRRAAALRHPELRPPHSVLRTRENEILERVYWQGLTCKEVGRQLGITGSRVGQLAQRALRKLEYHLSRGGAPGIVEDEHSSDDRLDEVLLTLNACGSVEAAAQQLGWSVWTLKGFMHRHDVTARTVFEVEG